MQRARWGMARFGFFTAIALALTTMGLWPSANTRAAQTKSADPNLAEMEPRILTTADGYNLHVSYYKSTMEKDAAVVVLLHMKDGNRFVWQADSDGFAKKLQRDGFAVITVDLRYHGENKAGGGAAAAGNANQGGTGKKKGKKSQGLDLKPADYEAMINLDMEAVKAFIYEEHEAGNLNMNKMGIVGPEMGASIAAAYTVLDWEKPPHDDGQPGFQTPRGQDVRALVLISPEEKYHGILMSKLAPLLKDGANQIAVLICSGNDLKEEAQAKKIFDMVNPPVVGNKEKDRLNTGRMYLKSYPAKLTGTDLLDKKEVAIEPLMQSFLDKHLKNLDSPWRDRKNKRERNKKN
jgi:pimeloyl-ACP methyl ester carboxylesterase